MKQAVDEEKSLLQDSLDAVFNDKVRVQLPAVAPPRCSPASCSPISKAALPKAWRMSRPVI
ncbi:MAG: hypothetical protein MZU97_25210 [Bacillus subtilis]|nr:hypothetical protein [Bacillus subtilis]